jgi:hypothetical protein
MLDSKSTQLLSSIAAEISDVEIKLANDDKVYKVVLEEIQRGKDEMDIWFRTYCSPHITKRYIYMFKILLDDMQRKFAETPPEKMPITDIMYKEILAEIKGGYSHVNFFTNEINSLNDSKHEELRKCRIRQLNRTLALFQEKGPEYQRCFALAERIFSLGMKLESQTLMLEFVETCKPQN